ncbi:hypothetical protein ABZ348_07530 [Streptomyces sp. NPDC005963]|uniref:hypothetical protein n=1 Tax=Streptomyces sp. NPDC005963 TaxID=3156721 RepID=UPI0033D78CDF
MSEHLDTRTLGELVLDRAPWPEADPRLAHVEGCAVCGKELAALRRVARAVRTATAADLPIAPPERVWHAIVHRLADPRA